MKLKDIEVGQSYLRRRGRGYTDQIVYVVDKGWKKRETYFGPRFVRGGSGVAIAVGAAYSNSGSWHPEVVPPAQIDVPMTEAELAERQAATAEAYRRRNQEAEQRETAIGEAVGRLTTLGVPAFKTGYGLGSTLSIRYEDIAKLEALIGEAS